MFDTGYENNKINDELASIIYDDKKFQTRMTNLAKGISREIENLGYEAVQMENCKLAQSFFILAGDLEKRLLNLAEQS